MKKYSLLLLSLIVLFSFGCKKENTPEKNWALYDIDKNGYDTVKIGTQFWMKQNLNTSHYRNGDPIPQITSASIWASLTTGAWCWYNNDSATYAATYGKLYNWYAVNDPRGLAPQGWHIPSSAEWQSFITTLGGSIVAGGAIKETGTTHWASPNTDATNSSKFTAQPGGVVNFAGNFYYQGFNAVFMTTTSSGYNYQAIFVEYNSGKIIEAGNNKNSGCSIRCIKD